MVSPFHFDSMLVSMRQVMGERRFARVQWVLSGDFCQLPSVMQKGSPEHKAYEAGLTKRFLFETAAWEEMRMFSIELDVNRRSSRNLEFCQVLAKARLGGGCASVRQKLRELTARTLESPQFAIFAVRAAT